MEESRAERAKREMDQMRLERNLGGNQTSYRRPENSHAAEYGSWSRPGGHCIALTGYWEERDARDDFKKLLSGISLYQSKNGVLAEIALVNNYSDKTWFIAINIIAPNPYQEVVDWSGKCGVYIREYENVDLIDSRLNNTFSMRQYAIVDLFKPFMMQIQNHSESNIYEESKSYTEPKLGQPGIRTYTLENQITKSYLNHGESEEEYIQRVNRENWIREEQVKERRKNPTLFDKIKFW